MDNEVSTSIQLVITLLVMSFVIAILALFMSSGRSFEREAVNKIADAQAETYATDLLNAVAYGALPTASVYVMLEKNTDAVKSLSGIPYGVSIHKVSDLAALFGKKVRLKIDNPNDPEKRYDITVKEE